MKKESHRSPKLKLSQLLLVPALLAMAGVSSASDIAWGSPQNITGASDVSLTGSAFGTWAPYNSNSSATPVNGVTFDSNSLGIIEESFNFGGDFWAGQNTADAGYNDLLSHAIYSHDGFAQFTLNGDGSKALDIGTTYQIQLWISDPRSLGVGTRTATVDSGDGSSVSDTIFYPGDGTGIGQYVIGTFTADATSQLIRVNANQTAQVNLLQVRTLPVPEPSGVLLGSLCLGGAFLRRRR